MMKKIITVMTVVFCLAASFVIPVSAATVNAVPEIVLEQTQVEFDVVFTVTNQEAYAGAEYALQCPGNVTVKSVKYSGEKSSAGPTAARGFVWFTYFSGKNDYSGNMTATVTLSYSGAENTSIVLDHISIHTQNNGKTDTEKQELRKTVIIRRKGADNEVPPLPPPTSSENTDGTTSSNTPPSGISSKPSGASTGDKQNQSDKTASDNGSSDSQTNPSDNSGTAQSSQIEDIPGDDSPSKNKPTDTQGTDCPWPHTLLLILLIISVLGNLTLGYLWINRNPKKQK